MRTPRSLRRTSAVLAFALSVGFAVGGCAGDEPPSELTAVATFRPGAPDEVVTGRLEVADTVAEQRRGLMGRTTLPADGGMLFEFDEPVTTGFWMKDTLIPLSIAFVGEDGRVVDTFEMRPCRADPCEVYRPAGEYTEALEMRAGWFADHGVGAGTEVEISRGT
jgi:uncharacterized membrane protein (UPF0127 family)